VLNLASKLLLALLPPGASFFRLNPNAKIESELEAQPDPGTAKATLDEALRKVEKRVMDRLEEKGARADFFEMMKHLLVGGNVLTHVTKSGQVLNFALSEYVVKRDGRGDPLEIVVKESYAPLSLPPEAQAIYKAEQPPEEAKDKSGSQTVDVFTHLLWADSRWGVYQEVCGKRIPGTEGSYPKDKLPWLPLRLTSMRGQDYGRGFVENYEGDLTSLEALTQSIVEWSAAAAHIVFLVDESGATSKQRLQEAQSGDFIDGREQDVTTLGLNKLADFQVASATVEKMERRLEQAFLLLSPRNAERVTAEEIRQVAEELEKSLGGVYTILGQELQRPLVSILMAQMQSAGELPALPTKAVVPQIVTGLEALGRSSDINKLSMLGATAVQTFGPQAASQFLDPTEFLKRYCTNLGIDSDGVVKSKDDLQQEAQQAQLAQMGQNIAPIAAKGLIDQNAAQSGQSPAPSPAPTQPQQ
jgi:hypothetical protein